MGCPPEASATKAGATEVGTGRATPGGCGGEALGKALEASPTAEPNLASIEGPCTYEHRELGHIIV